MESPWPFDGQADAGLLPVRPAFCELALLLAVLFLCVRVPHMVLGVQRMRWGPAACRPPLRASFIMCQGEMWVCIRSVFVRRLLSHSAHKSATGCR